MSHVPSRPVPACVPVLSIEFRKKKKEKKRYRPDRYRCRYRWYVCSVYVQCGGLCVKVALVWLNRPVPVPAPVPTGTGTGTGTGPTHGSRPGPYHPTRTVGWPVPAGPKRFGRGPFSYREGGAAVGGGAWGGGLVAGLVPNQNHGFGSPAGLW